MNKFAQFETVKKYKLLPNEFSIEKGEMTPKMSIVRKKAISNYENLIESIYKK
jgi:long-chain acyl-CoA synthetase